MSIPPPPRRRYTIIGLVFQYVSMGLSVAQGLLLVPLFLKYLSLELYGAWLAMSGAVVWLAMLDPGVSAVFQQRIGAAYGRRDRPGMEAAIGTGVALNALVYALLIALAFAVAPVLPGLLHIHGEQSQLLIRCFLLETAAEALLSLAMTVVAVPIAVMVFPVTVGLVYLVVTASGFLLTAWLLTEGWGLLALPAGSLLRGGGLLLANGVIAVWTCRMTMPLRPRLDREEFRAITGLTGYSWLGRIGDGMTGELDAFFLGHFLGPATVPIMTMTRNAADVIHQLASRVAFAFLPALTHFHSEKSAEASRVVTLRLLRIVAWTASIGVGGYVALNERFVGLWVGPQFFGGKTLTLLFAGLLLWQAGGRAISRILFSFGRIRETSLISLSEAVLRAAVLFALLHVARHSTFVPMAGLIAALATGGWYLPRLLSRELALDRVHSWGLVRDALAGIILLTAMGLAWPRLTPDPTGWLGFVVQAAVFSACGLGALALISKEFRSESLLYLSPKMSLTV